MMESPVTDARERTSAYNEHIRLQVAELTDVRRVRTRKQLGDELGCGRQSLGRKIRSGGFSAYEVAYLVERYGISARLGDRALSFTMPLAHDAAADADNYVESLAAIGRELDAVQPDRSQMRTRILSGDVPAPLLYCEPVLALLKLYSFESARRADLPAFDIGVLRAQRRGYLAECAQRYAYYAALPSEEIWGRNPFHAVFAVIDYLVGADRVTEADLAEVFAALRRLREVLGRALRSGVKAEGGSLRLYQNPTYALSTVTTIRTDVTHHALMRLSDPLYGISNQAFTVEACDAFIDAAKAKSTLVGGDGSGNYPSWLAAIGREVDAHEERALGRLASR